MKFSNKIIIKIMKKLERRMCDCVDDDAPSILILI
jgi:hypothetical protein